MKDKFPPAIIIFSSVNNNNISNFYKFCIGQKRRDFLFYSAPPTTTATITEAPTEPAPKKDGRIMEKILII